MLPEIAKQALIVILGLGMGENLGRAFQDFDDKFNGQYIKNRILQYLVKGFLRFCHHWYLGIALILSPAYLNIAGDLALYLMAFGWGLVLSDIKDVPDFLRKIALTIPLEFRVKRKRNKKD